MGKLSFDSTPASSTDGHSGYGLESGFCTISRLPRVEKHSNRDRDRDPDHSQDREQSSFPSEPTPNPELRRSDSLLSFRFDLDLGPSLLSELLGVMSLSEAPAAETPVPTANPPAPAANPAPTAKPPAHAITTLDAVTSLPASAVTSLPAPAVASSPSRGHFPNGVTPVPTSVQVNAFEFADAEEDDEVKV